MVTTHTETDPPRDESQGSVHIETPMLNTLSPSRASDFKTCPQLYKFKAIDKIPTEPTIYQARGTTAHLALERLFGEVEAGGGCEGHQHQWET